MNSYNPPPLFDWTLMRSFIAVIDEGSLQAAARKLHSSQPTVGRHIAMLEQQLSNRLFDRRARQLLPTPLALSIAAHARTMEASANAIGMAMRAQDAHDIDHIRISASQCTSCYLLPPILVELRQQEPTLTIDVVSSNYFVNLQRREADIAVRMARPEEENLVAKRLGVVNLGAYAHKSYLKKHGIPQEPKDLLRHSLIGYDNHKAILVGFENMGLHINKDAFSLRSDDHMMVWHAIRHGLGIGFTSHYVANRDPDVVRILPHMPIPPLDVWITLHEDLHSHPGIRRIYDFLARHIVQRLAAPDMADRGYQLEAIPA